MVNLKKRVHLRLHNFVSGRNNIISRLLRHRRCPCHHLLQLQVQTLQLQVQTLQRDVFAWKAWIVDEWFEILQWQMATQSDALSVKVLV